jgi:hypothetical protein
MRATKALGVVAPVVALLVVVAAAVSVGARWPHQFGGHGSRNHMVHDFVTSGTAMSPPLIVLMLLVAAAASVRRADRRGTVACLALVLLGALMIVGSVGEAVAPRTPDVPHEVQLFSGAWGATAGLVLASLAITSMSERHARAQTMRA